MDNKIKQKDLAKIVKSKLEDKGYKLNLEQSDELTMTVINTVLELALDDKEVYLHGTGIIKSKIKKGRLGRNPKTGEPLVITDKKTIVLEVSRRFKEQINK